MLAIDTAAARGSDALATDLRRFRKKLEGRADDSIAAIVGE
jgi:hypothetical protein